MSACDKFVPGVLDNLIDIFVSEGDSMIMSALCAVFEPSIIASSSSLSQETLATLCEFLNMCSLSYSADLGSGIYGFHEFVRHMGSNVSLSTVKDIAQVSVRNKSIHPVVGYLAKRIC